MAPRPHDYASRGGGGGVIGRRRRCGASGCQEFSSPSLFCFLSEPSRSAINHLSSMLAAFLCLAGSTPLLFLSQPVPLPPSLFLSWLLSPPSLCNKPLLACVRSFGAPKAVTSSAAASGIPGLLLLVVSLPLELASLAQKQVRIQFSPPAPLLHASSLFLVKKNLIRSLESSLFVYFCRRG
jgi:hypothetical protein